MKKGAQPSDRVTRFLDAAGIMKRPKRNNPEKAIPRKERKAKDEEATKAKEAGDAAAKTAATAKAAADKAAAEKPAEAPAASLRLAASRRGQPYLRCPYRRRARCARRSETVVVYRRSRSGRTLRSAGDAGWRAVL